MTDGWDSLNTAVEDALAKVEAKAPDASIAEEGRAYVSRIATAALNTAFLGHRLTSHGLAMPLPVQGGPNPDYIMRHAMIDPGQSYRLDGRLNGSERVGIGLYTVGQGGAPQLAAYETVEKADCCADGGFSLAIASDATGVDALAIPPGARLLIIRALHRDNSEPAHFALSGKDVTAGPSLVGGSNATALGFAANQLRNTVAQYMPWIDAALALPNCLAHAPEELAETVVGDAQTQYFLGGFCLADDEWLEVIMPAGLTGYWSLHVYNFWYEHLCTPGAHDRNAVVEEDGSIRIAVGPGPPPSAKNRIETLGRNRGAFICRIVGGPDDMNAPQVAVHQVQT